MSRSEPQNPLHAPLNERKQRDMKAITTLTLSAAAVVAVGFATNLASAKTTSVRLAAASLRP